MLKKKFLKTKCKVEFIFPASAASNIDTITLVGDFNDWNENDTPLAPKGQKGDYAVTLDLNLNESYQFRYLVNGEEWRNDWDADAYAPNPYNGDNSVVNTTPEG